MLRISVSFVLNDIIFKDMVLLSTVWIRLDVAIEDDESERLIKFIYSLPRMKSLVMGTEFLEYLAKDIVRGSLPVESVCSKSLSMTINFRSLKEIFAALCILLASAVFLRI
ncbi:hypothetical protein GIB67_031468 [Kingdonia uniflora]|uniref:Uncharacterized protein n=1 Tax=Kingdonia uniflora TaxID=39325 RepID=A0A7J7MNF8_9MAGN|nr:hypothetical protein GIB67_031468 [Kingdonia uniflora]